MLSSSSGFKGLYRASNASVVGTSRRRRDVYTNINANANASGDEQNLLLDHLVEYYDGGVVFDKEAYIGNDVMAQHHQRLLHRGRRAANLTTVNYADAGSVSSPVVCLELNQVVLFVVSRTNYPIYDKDNLLNRQDDPAKPFDQTPFLTLQASMSQLQVASTVFAYAFTSPGVAVLVDPNTALTTVFAVMTENTACPAIGPFFPPTASAYHTLGVSQTRSLLQSPDWALVGYITGGGVALVLLLVLVLLVFKRKGWKKEQTTSPRYRHEAQDANFDEFASKGSQLQTKLKLYPGTAAATAIVPSISTTSASTSTTAGDGGLVSPGRLTVPVISVVEGPGGSGGNDAATVATSATVDNQLFQQVSDEYWDYNRQIDLEGFDVNKFFGLLDAHTNTIRGTLSSHKEEIEQLYRKSSSQTAALRSLWSVKLNLRDCNRLTTAATDDPLGHARRMGEIEAEMNRRRTFGEFFGSLLTEQRSLLTAFHRDSTTHDIMLDASVELFVQHCHWLLEMMHTGAPGPIFREMITVVQDLHTNLQTEHDKECLRRGTLCALSTPQSLGGKLVAPGQTTPVPLSRLMVADHLFESDLLTQDPNTQLFHAQKGVMMLNAEDHVVAIPPNYFVHPSTGRVLPIEGAVAYNPLSGRLVAITDMVSFATYTELIPFIPFPSQAAHCNLKSLPTGTVPSVGLLFSDPVHGQPVKMLACTMDSAGSLLPVGGTYRHPLTGLLTPIDIGMPMLDTNSAICPIAGVALSPVSGEVVPVGGFVAGKTLGSQTAMVDPMYSLLPLPVTGGRLDAITTNVVAVLAGGRTCLDNMEMAKEQEIITQFGELVAHLTAPDLLAEEALRKLLSQLQGRLDALARDMSRIRAQLHATHAAKLSEIALGQAHMAEVVKHSGSVGYFMHATTGDTVHVLPGMDLVDSETRVAVPILGAMVDGDNDTCVPLGGVMDDINNHSPDAVKVPITIGAQFIEPGTGSVEQVVGVVLDTESQAFVPSATTPNWTRRPRPSLPQLLLEVLDEEIVARKSHRRRQRAIDDDALQIVFRLGLQVLGDSERFNGKDLSSDASQLLALSESRQQGMTREAARREYFGSTELPPEVLELVGLLDKREMQVEDEIVTAYGRGAEIAHKFVGEIAAVGAKFEPQMKARDERATVMETYRGELRAVTSTYANKFAIMFQHLCRLRCESQLTAEMFVALGSQARTVLQYFMRIQTVGSARKNGGQVNEALKELLQTLRTGGIAALASGAGVGAGIRASASTTTGAGNAGMGANGEMVDQQGPRFLRMAIGGAQMNQPQQQQHQQQHLQQQQPQSQQQQQQQEQQQSVEQVGGVSSLDSTIDPQAGHHDPRKLVELLSGTGSARSDDLDLTGIQGAGDGGDGGDDRRLTFERMTSSDRPMSALSMRRPSTRMLDRPTHLETYATDMTKLDAELRATEKDTLNAILTDCEQQRREGLEALSHQLVAALAAGNDPNAMQAYEDGAAELVAKIERDQATRLAEAMDMLANARCQQEADIIEISRDVPDDEEAPSVDRAKEELALLAAQLAEFQRGLALAEYDESMASSTNSSMMAGGNTRDESMQRLVDSMNSSRRRNNNKGGAGASAGADEVSVPAALQKEVANIAQESKGLTDRSAAVRERIAQRKQARIKTVQDDTSLTSQESKEKIAAIEFEAKIAEGALKTAVVARKESALQALQAHAAQVPNADAIAKMIKDNVDSARAQQTAGRERQKERLKAKLAARQRLLETKAQMNASDTPIESAGAQAESQTEAQIAQGAGGAGGAATSEEDEATKRLEEEYLARQLEIDVRKQQKLSSLQGQLDQELAQLELEEKRSLEAAADRTRAMQERERKAQFERDVEAQRTTLSDAEYKRLVAEHAQQTAALNDMLDREKREQMSSLKDRLQARRVKREAAAKAQVTLDATSEQLNEDKKLVESYLASQSQAENAALVSNFSGDDSASMTVIKALQKRHAFEFAQRTQLMDKEKTVARERALAEFDIKREADHSALLQRQGEEMMKLATVNAAGVDDAEMQRRKAALRNEHKKQMIAFESKTDTLREHTVKDIVLPLEMSHREQQQRMKEAQYKEISDVLRQCSPENAMVKQYEDASLQARKRADDFKKKVETDSRLRFEKEKAGRLEADKVKRQALADEVQRKKAEFEAAQDVIAQKEMEAKRAQELREKEELLQRQLAEADEETRKKLIDQHLQEVRALNQNFDALRQHHDDMLAEKLAKRRQRKQERSKTHVPISVMITQASEDSLPLPPVSITVEPSGRVSPGGSLMPDQASDNASVSSNGSGAGAGAGAGVGVVQPTLQEEQLAQAMLQSPFGQVFRKLNDIERMIQSGAVVSASATGGAAATADAPFVDAEDRRWDSSKATAVDPADIASLAPVQFALYRFGVFVTRMLSVRCGCPKVLLLLAHDLPAEPTSINAFRNSYRYEAQTRVLFVRAARLQHVGDLTLVLAHALAHVKCGDMTNDRNPVFIREFYLALRVLGQDLFAARARQPITPATESTTSTSSHPLQAQFPKLTMEEKVNFVNSAMDLSTEVAASTTALNAKYRDMLSASELESLVKSTTTAPNSSETHLTAIAEDAEDAGLTEMVAVAKEQLNASGDRAAQLAERALQLGQRLELHSDVQ